MNGLKDRIEKLKGNSSAVYNEIKSNLDGITLSKLVEQLDTQLPPLTVKGAVNYLNQISVIKYDKESGSIQAYENMPKEDIPVELPDPVEHVYNMPLEFFRPHPDNEGIYTNHDISDIEQSMLDEGCKQPLVTKPDGTIISGHRRLRVALKNKGKFSELPTMIREYETPDQERLNLLTFNKYRTKTYAEQMNEIKMYRDLMGRGAVKGGRTSEVIAKMVGVGGSRQLERMEYLEKNAPSSVKDLLEKGEITVGAAYNQVAEMMTEKDPEILKQVKDEMETQEKPSVKKAKQAVRQKKIKEKIESGGIETIRFKDKYQGIIMIPNWDLGESGVDNKPLREIEMPDFMSAEQIADVDIGGRRIEDLVSDKTILALAVPPEMAEYGHDLLRMWGLEFVDQIIWCQNEPISDNGLFQRASTTFLIGASGQFDRVENVKNWFVEDVDAWEPPQFLVKLIEAMTDGDLLMVYSKRSHEGWDHA